jgi:hypothetical protein
VDLFDGQAGSHRVLDNAGRGWMCHLSWHHVAGRGWVTVAVGCQLGFQLGYRASREPAGTQPPPRAYEDIYDEPINGEEPCTATSMPHGQRSRTCCCRPLSVCRSAHTWVTPRAASASSKKACAAANERRSVSA